MPGQRDTIIINHRNASNENSVNDQVRKCGLFSRDGGEGIDISKRIQVMLPSDCL